MATAFIDDSASEGAAPVFVLGGYVATAATWANFTTEWDVELKRGPKLEYFKLREAYAKRPTGQFYGRSRDDCLARIARFRAIIENHPVYEVGIGFRIDEYRRAFDPFTKPKDNPYYFGSATLITAIAHGLEELGLPREPLDIVFDEQVMEKVRVLESWEAVRKRRANNLPDLLANILKNSPSWRDDVDVLPLQAADMHATYLRICFDAAHAEQPSPPLPGFTKLRRGFIIMLTEAELQERARRIAASIGQDAY
jgi:hypothetical protein